MTTDITVYRTYYEETWDSITAWLDEMFSTRHHNHRQVHEFAMDTEALSYDLHSLQQDITNEDVTPTFEISSHRLGLRLRDLPEVLERKWGNPRVRLSAERALRGIHEHFLGKISPAREQEVLFETTQVISDTHFHSYVQTHLLASSSRWGQTPAGRLNQLVVVEGALWAYDLFRHLSEPTLRGSRLREHYMANPRQTWAQYGHFVGRVIDKPTEDSLDTALRLWSPEVENSPYARLADAMDAAQLL